MWVVLSSWFIITFSCPFFFFVLLFPKMLFLYKSKHAASTIWNCVATLYTRSSALSSPQDNTSISSSSSKHNDSSARPKPSSRLMDIDSVQANIYSKTQEVKLNRIENLKANSRINQEMMADNLDDHHPKTHSRSSSKCYSNLSSKTLNEQQQRASKYG